MQRPPRKRSATRTVKRSWNRRSVMRARLSRQTHTTRLIQRPNTKTRVQLPSRLSMVVSIVAVPLAARTSENIRQTPSSLPSTASRKFRRSLGTSRRPFVGPVKGSVGRAMVVSNKGQDAGAQLLHGEATEPGKQAAHEEREPDLNLVEKGDCVGECTRNECDGQGRRERLHGCSSWRDGHLCL